VLDRQKITTKVHFRGYDLKAYAGPSTLSEEDVGQLEVGITRIEVKTTRFDTVSISDVQACTATENPQDYWLCVVQVSADRSTDSLDADYVRLQARFVSDIGSLLADPRQQLVGAAQKAHAVDIELQHMDGIRYKISRVIWESRGVGLEEFVQRIGTTVTTHTPQDQATPARD